ncbi:cytochrome p450 [Holotrichia oblita]|uniref:Cytochrome p450 n=1 Tax=Holotrichia oblita TaxID=644536 RepID=A0ACB9T4I1_HOLOL|nr:cytochrome p450 [Holotrichia oblita]
MNAKEVLACFTTDVIGSSAFGIDCNSFKDPDADFRKYGRKLFEITWKAAFARFLGIIIPRFRRLGIEQDVQQFFVDSFTKIVELRESGNFKRNDFVQLMLDINQNAEATGSKNGLKLGQMLAQSIMFFAAGFETSSTTMTFCLHELAHNIEIQQRLREEINATMQKYDGKLTYDAIIEMKYLNMVLDETLRKYPPASMINRVCTKDYEIEGTGVTIETGTRVFVSILGLHRDPEYFPNPGKFDPERFSDENKSNIRSFTYLPFGEGPRICIGMILNIAKGHSFGGLYLISKPALLIVEPELIKKILSKDFVYFTSHGVHVDEEKDPISGNLFGLDGDKWRNMRVKLTPTFTSGKIKMMYHTILTCGEPMVDHVKMLSRKGELLNAKEVLACFTTDVIGSCAFGIDCNSFKDPNSEFRKFGRQIFDLSWRASFYRLIKLIMPRLKLSTMNKEVKKFFTNSFKDIVIFRQTSKVKRNDFIQLMLEINEKAEANGTTDSLSIGQMLAQSVMFFAAGFETSSTTMTFCLHELAHKLDIQEKLRKEIITTFQKHDGKLTYDAVMEMKYLNMVLEETLRKYPPGAVIHRVCTKDYIIEGKNTKVEAGTTAFISILGLHTDPEYFPNPDSFDPERFSDENRSSIRPYTYLPFGEGPRICIETLRKFPPGALINRVSSTDYTIEGTTSTFRIQTNSTPKDFQMKIRIMSVRL